MSTIDPKNLCPGCMAVLDEPDLPCPLCGFDKNTYSPSPRSLRPFTILSGKYLVGKVIGEGGFGITYIGFNLDTELPVAIKEYFPSELATRDIAAGNALSIFAGESQQLYKEGLEKYLREARNLTMFSDLPGIVTVKDFFYENETAYIIMEYINGITLKQHLIKVGGRMSQSEVIKMMKPVLESMIKIHETGMIHRDISPDNIMITRNNQIKLTDFGAARVCNGEDNKSITVVLKRGYAPEEQYRVKGSQGPWTDVYALCATMYRMITGITPQEALERIIEDSVEPLSKFDKEIWPEIEYAIMKGLSLRAPERFQNVGELVDALYYSVIEKDETGNTKIVSTKDDSVAEVSQPQVSQPQEDNDDDFVIKPIVINVGSSSSKPETSETESVQQSSPVSKPELSSQPEGEPQSIYHQPLYQYMAYEQTSSNTTESPSSGSMNESQQVQKPVTQPMQTPPQQPASQYTQTPPQQPASQYTQTPPQQPASQYTQTPPQKPVSQPVQTLPQQPVSQPVQTPPQKPVSQPVQTPPQQPVSRPVQTPPQQSVSKPASTQQAPPPKPAKKAGGFFKSTFKKVVKLKLGKVRFEDDIVELNVEHNDVGSIQVLRECVHLQKLILSNNMVDDLSPLVDCRKLTYLALRNTRVDDLRPLSGLTSLTYLDLWGTRIHSLEPLYSIKGLKYINVKNTEITKSQIDDFKIVIPECEVEI
ncbi:MAG: protein kinase [Lachnospiraceae bacterium]|nr:protein kinase [Lachnospiraceae bacterium]